MAPEGSPLFTTMKRSGSGHEKQKGHDLLLSKDKTGWKAGIGMSSMQPDKG